MSEWASGKILNSWFITHETPNGYEIHFATPDMEKYLAVQEECRRQIRHAKPMTNADKYFRNATDEEIASFLAAVNNHRQWSEQTLMQDLDADYAYYLDWLKQEVCE